MRSEARMAPWITLFCLAIVLGVAIDRAAAQAPVPRILDRSDPIARIINGEPTDEFPSVGIVGGLSAGGFCTGTLISPTHVLTAAHCAEFLIAMEGPTGGTFELDGEVYRTAQVIIHPDYNPDTLENDIAILELSTAVPDIEPAKIYRDAPRVGQELILVGYGSGGTGESGEDGTFGLKMVGTTELEVVEDKVIGWRFDNNNESNTAPGDSGGPAFLEIDGELFIAGITSSGTNADAGLGDMSSDTRVDAFDKWIDSVVSPIVLPPPGDEEEEEENEEDQEHPMCPSRTESDHKWGSYPGNHWNLFWLPPFRIGPSGHGPKETVGHRGKHPNRSGNKGLGESRGPTSHWTSRDRPHGGKQAKKRTSNQKRGKAPTLAKVQGFGIRN